MLCTRDFFRIISVFCGMQILFQNQKIYRHCSYAYNGCNPIVSQGVNDFLVVLWTYFFIDECLIITILNFTN